MNMVGVSSNFYGMAIQLTANTSEVTVKFILVWRKDKWASVFGAKDDMNIIFY